MSDSIRYSSDGDDIVVKKDHFAHRLKFLADDVSRDTGKYFFPGKKLI